MTFRDVAVQINLFRVGITGAALDRLHGTILCLSAGLLLPKNLSKLFFIFGDFPKHVGGHVANFQGSLVEFSRQRLHARAYRNPGDVANDILTFFGKNVVDQ